MVHRLPLAAFVISSALLLTAVAGLLGCGNAAREAATSTLSLGETTASSTSTTAGTTVSPPSGGTTVAVPTGTSGGPLPETTVYTGTTVSGSESQTRALTFLGPATSGTWLALRKIVMSSGGDGQKVLDEVVKLAAGPPVDVGSAELDAVSGIGFAAGAGTSQPIGVAIGDDGHQVMVFAFGVTGRPDATTIVGFERQTNLVGLVEGPLPISSSTGNLTTIPSP